MIVYIVVNARNFLLGLGSNFVGVSVRRCSDNDASNVDQGGAVLQNWQIFLATFDRWASFGWPMVRLQWAFCSFGTSLDWAQKRLLLIINRWLFISKLRLILRISWLLWILYRRSFFSRVYAFILGLLTTVLGIGSLRVLMLVAYRWVFAVQAFRVPVWSIVISVGSTTALFVDSTLRVGSR